MGVTWDDEVDDVLAGDLAAAVGYTTPARGVVLTPMSPLGLRDRAAGTLTLTSPVALPAKLVALRRDPAIAVAFHAREHGRSGSAHVVLVQGRAGIGPVDRGWLESITPQWERALGPRDTGLVGRLLAPYHWQRVAITVAVERVVVLEDGGHGARRVLGAALPPPPPAQPPPGGGTGPRVAVAKAAAHAERIRHTLLGWTGGDGLPVVVPVTGSTADATGLRLTTPARDLLPPGGRRAGLLSYSFGPRVSRQEIRRGSGWLEVDGAAGTVHFTPHTAHGFAVPESRAVFVLGAAVATRAGRRRARALGFDPSP